MWRQQTGGYFSANKYELTMPLPMQRSHGLTDARAITVRPVVDFIGTIREHSIQLAVQYASRCSSCAFFKIRKAVCVQRLILIDKLSVAISEPF
jgi:hypothetical protein